MKNNDEKCFKYDLIAFFHHKENNNFQERIRSLKSFIQQYKWKKKNCLPKSKALEEFNKYNSSSTLNILFINNSDENNIEIKQAYLIIT